MAYQATCFHISQACFHHFQDAKFFDHFFNRRILRQMVKDKLDFLLHRPGSDSVFVRMNHPFIMDQSHGHGKIIRCISSHVSI